MHVVEVALLVNRARVDVAPLPDAVSNARIAVEERGVVGLVRSNIRPGERAFV
ncbi:protein of unassigned function [Methylobacterium oryzae CBMB20]|uniref:Protein of unassigned function n=1 Tax=Methylobacterium oryzae CBMB20 TaxID=693986 RepID=A0A089NUR4_9HYPH|nr:protein of unassigned function [Methylobacterium oryzae CBMB20]